nr:hypothetical protein [Acidipila sp. EB88]
MVELDGDHHAVAHALGARVVVGPIGDVGEWAVGVGAGLEVDALGSGVAVEKLLEGALDFGVSFGGSFALLGEEVAVVVGVERAAAVAGQWRDGLLRGILVRRGLRGGQAAGGWKKGAEECQGKRRLESTARAKQHGPPTAVLWSGGRGVVEQHGPEQRERCVGVASPASLRPLVSGASPVRDRWRELRASIAGGEPGVASSSRVTGCVLLPGRHLARRGTACHG